MGNLIVFLSMVTFFTLSGYQFGKIQAGLNILESPNLTVAEAIKCDKEIK